MENKYASNENFRNSILDSYNLALPLPDPDYDELIFLTSLFCKVPVAYLSIIKKSTICFKAQYGIMMEEIPRKNSYTQTLLESGKEIMSLSFQENTSLFEKNNGLFKQEHKFYTGVLLKDPKGFPLGALCILDVKERKLDDLEVKGLKALANQGMKLIEYSKQSHQFEQIQNKLKQKYEELEKFASLVSHDIKSPLANIISLTELLKEENEGKLNEDTTQYLNYLVESSYSLRNYVDGILSFYRSEHILEKDYENVDLHQVLKGIAKLYEVSDDVIFAYPKYAILHNVNKAALTQVFLNLIGNGLKYNKKQVRKITINFEEQDSHYYFEVIDNGEGFPEAESARIFELFTTLDVTDRDGNPGTGIGLATVHKLVKNMGGSIDVRSTPGEGSVFSFTIMRL